MPSGQSPNNEVPLIDQTSALNEALLIAGLHQHALREDAESLNEQLRAEIAARKEAEERVRISEMRFRRLFETAQDGILILDLDSGKVTDANPFIIALLGYTREEFVGKELWEFGLLKDQERSKAAFRRVLETGSARYEDLPLQTKAGERRDVEFVSNLYDEDGRKVVQCNIRDIAKRKRAEDGLKDAERRKDDFLAMLGHELRNPLAPIRNASNILKRVNTTDPTVQRAREMIDRQVSQMARLIDELLDVSRIARGKVQLRKDSIDLTQMMRVFAVDYQPTMEGGGLTFERCISDRALWIHGDPARIQQIVGNLLNNALKFTNSGGKVTLGLDVEHGRTALISVQDTGIGMLPETMTRIFEPFNQADSSVARSRGGLGLGLALVKGLTELHGGTVQAESAGLGRGSRFIVRLPLQKQIAAPRPEKLDPVKKRTHRILIIEDNLDAAESLQVLLSIVGHEVAVAHSGLEGLNLAHEFRPDIVLSDIGLPGEMDGYALARAIRKDPHLSSAYLVAMTGYGQEEDRRHAREAGFDHHITKPAEPEVLERLLSR
ncbi:MAG TPA: ATP-binding protein [Planctomycetota bacterium]|jgi:PAS domain S-box-containing protein